MASPERMCSSGINGEEELRGQPANPGSPGTMAVKMVCVCVCVLMYSADYYKAQRYTYHEHRGWRGMNTQLLHYSLLHTHTCPRHSSRPYWSAATLNQHNHHSYNSFAKMYQRILSYTLWPWTSPSVCNSIEFYCICRWNYCTYTFAKTGSKTISMLTSNA